MYKYFYFTAILIFVVLGVILVVNSVHYGRIHAWLERAKDAGNPAQVAEFLSEYQLALQKENLIEGKYYSVFKYPATKMPIYMRVIDGLIVRAEALVEQSPADTSYQMGLVNLEKDLGDIDARAFSVWFANGGFIYVWLEVLLGIYLVFGWIPFPS